MKEDFKEVSGQIQDYKKKLYNIELSLEKKEAENDTLKQELSRIKKQQKEYGIAKSLKMRDTPSRTFSNLKIEEGEENEYTHTSSSNGISRQKSREENMNILNSNHDPDIEDDLTSSIKMLNVSELGYSDIIHYH